MLAALPFFYVSLVLNVFLVILAIWLVTRYQELLESYHVLKQSKDRSKKLAATWLDEARLESEEIIKRAQEKASMILTETSVFDDEMKSKLDASLQQMAGRIGTEVAGKMVEEVGEVAGALSTQAMSSFAKAQEEVEKYKKEEFAKIDQEIDKIVTDISREVLGQALDKADQEELVRRALSKLPGVGK